MRRKNIKIMDSSDSYDSDDFRNMSHQVLDKSIRTPLLSSVVQSTETHNTIDTRHMNSNIESMNHQPGLNMDHETIDTGTQVLHNDNNIYRAYDPANDRIDDAYIYYDIYRCIFPFRDSRLSEQQKKCMNYTFVIILLGIFVIGATISIVSLIKLKMSTPN